jgi:branched-chain amino acid transport system permease protein
MTTTPLTTAGGTRSINLSFLLMAVFVGLAVVFVALGPYLMPDYYVTLITRAFLFATAVLTVSVLWGLTGILTFSQAAFFGVGAYAAGLMFTHVGFSMSAMIGAVLLGILVAMLLAAFIGWLAFWHGATPIYVAVVTLVIPIGVVQIIYAGGSFTGASTGLSGFDMVAMTRPQRYWLAGTTVVVLTIAAWLFARSDYGRVLRAIRENESRCRYLGIHTSRVKTWLMIAMAGVASVAGFIYACTGRAVAPEHADFVFGTELIVYAALAGRAFVVAAVVGTLGLEVLSGYVSSLLPFSWRLFIGLLFVLVILYLPQGLLPPVGDLAGRVLARGLRALSPHTAVVDDQTSATEVTRSATPASGPVASVGDAHIALTVEGLAKSYGALSVLKDVGFQVRSGEFIGIVGPNGAGKTTLMSCLSNGKERSGGTVRVFGEDIGRSSPSAIAGLGLGRSFQNTSLFNALTVFECLRLARYRQQPPSLIKRSVRLDIPDGALRVIEQTDLIGRLGERVENLSHGQKRALELAMVLALEPKVILLDEPTAGLTKTDRQMIGTVLTSLRDESGLSVLLIEHDFDFVKEVCSRLIVLHEGRVMLDGPTQLVISNPLLKEIYSGEEVVR